MNLRILLILIHYKVLNSDEWGTVIAGAPLLATLAAVPSTVLVVKLEELGLGGVEPE
jgi:hypothetical protein